MERTSGEITGARGLRLAWQAWLSSADPRANILISHGLGEHSGRYGHVVDALSPHGYNVYALDHRGHGRSDGPRAYVGRLDYVVADLLQLLDQIEAEGRRAPMFLLGHSLGGCVALEFALRHQDRLDGLALSGPVAALESASPAVRAVSRVFSVILPRLGILHVEPAEISRDPEVVADYERDPLVFHGKAPVRTIAEAAEAIESFPKRMARLRVPLLVMHGTDDRLSAPAGSRMVYEQAGSKDKTLKLYDGFYHEIFNEPAPDRDRPLGDLAQWLNARAGANRRALETDAS